MPTIGEQLKQTRLTRKLTLKQAVQATRVRAYYLEAMETDDFASLPSPAQARGFLRLYAEYLHLDADELLARLRGDAEAEPASPPASQPDTPPPGVPTPPAEPPSWQSPAAQSAPRTTIAVTVDSDEEAVPEPERPAGPPLASERIFTEIGSLLRERRELLSLTLDEIERHIHVRKHYLEKIETGNFDDLPSPVQARGMLNSYASFLDMDADNLLLRFAEALQARRIERQPAQTAKPAQRFRPGFPIWLKRFISPDLIFGGSMILLMLGLSIWGAARLLSRNAPAAATATEGPSISEILLATPVGGETPTSEALPTSVPELATAAPTLDPALVTPTDIPTQILDFTPASAVQLTVVVLERTFLRVTVDGVIEQEGRVAPGAALTFDGNERIEVLTGSGAAIQMIYNQQDLGILGNLGEVVDRVYTRNGVETPTPTATATFTATPRRQPTGTPTVTPRITATPTH